MIKYFTPIEGYAFDADKLKADFQRIEQVYPDKRTYWLTMLTSEAANEMISLYDTTYVKNLYPPEAFQDMAAIHKANHRKLSMDNFHFFMKGTYTHDILLQLEADLRSKGKRITAVLYHNLEPSRCHLMHSDMLEIRYHIPVTTNPHAYFLMEDGPDTDDYDVWRMPALGKIHLFDPSAMHTAMNCGFENRVHLVIDYMDIE